MLNRDANGYYQNKWPQLSSSNENAKLRVLSLGAGVQSSTMALMAARGDIGPMPDAAIFADTGWEPAAVYKWLDWLETQLPFPVVRVQRNGPDLGELAIAVADGSRTLSGSPVPPYYLRDPKGMVPKQCSKEFKTRVVGAEIRRRLGLEPKQRAAAGVEVEQWIGISTDEVQRVKDAEQSFVKNRWPLIESGMDRNACLRWMENHQYPTPPRSSCVFCPFRRNDEWRLLRDSSPADWERAINFDRAIRHTPGIEGTCYVHRSGTPLSEVDLSSGEDSTQQVFGFIEECEGVCGV